MERYLIDTNAVSDYFSVSYSIKGMKFMDEVIDGIPNLSVITQIELLSWNIIASAEQKVKDFISESIILNITPEVIAQCVDLRKTKKIKTPDAIIAGTALAHDYTLVTGNEKDFTNIKGLKLLNPKRYN